MNDRNGKNCESLKEHEGRPLIFLKLNLPIKQQTFMDLSFYVRECEQNRCFILWIL